MISNKSCNILNIFISLILDAIGFLDKELRVKSLYIITRPSIIPRPLKKVYQDHVIKYSANTEHNSAALKKLD